MRGDACAGHFSVRERLQWGAWVTAKFLKEKPVHRWYTFPHSFTGELVHALIDEWELGAQDRLLDPFCGAGTTLLAAKERGVPANGYDLSPLAVLVADVKAANHDGERLSAIWRRLKRNVRRDAGPPARKEYPELVERALPGRLLGEFEAVATAIERLRCSRAEKDFFLLALLAVLPEHSRAVATGGWLKWVDDGACEAPFFHTFNEQVRLMLQDTAAAEISDQDYWRAVQADARSLPDEDDTYSAVISSPPYPNRHDYTRVFGVELMFAFLDWDETKALRYQSFHSHPEARPERPDPAGYVPPRSLLLAVEKVRETEKDARVLNMLEGYFLDMFIALRELKRVCKSGARVALVVGNVQYRGVPIIVDELTAEVGEQAGLSCDPLLVASVLT